ncbi:MAG: hypothetical protein H7Z14_00680 [Anaerolineae bacterium]|nr:hypothetical protein [Phycisphaerae bacterium]
MNSRYHLNRILLAVATAISFALFWFVGSWFNIPINRGFNASMLAQPSAVMTMLVIAIAILVSVVICTLVAGSVRSDAGLFCTALGLMALSIRGGPIRNSLFDAKPSIFFTLAIELLLLFAIFGVVWLIVARMRAMGLSKQDDPHFKPNDEDFSQKIIATAIQSVATLALMSILCRTDQKAQALASVGVASMVGSIVAIMVAPTRPSVWFWPGPLLVGLLGYLWASMNPQNLSIGQPAGYFAALAKALPLDYASAGIAGSMLGYWFGRAWTSEQEEVQSESTTNVAAQQSI